MAASDWPKWKGGPTLAQYAFNQLIGGDNAPFDGDLTTDAVPDPAQDWAVRAARGIIHELDDRGAAFSEAFHPEKIDRQTRIEIIEVMAAIIRQAESNS